MFRPSRYDHVSDALATLRWLRLPHRVDLKVAVMAFRVLHGLAPPYLNDLVRVADLSGRRRLRLSSSHQLTVPPTFRLTTVGRRTFPVIASLLWNSLPSDIQSSPSLPVFRQHLSPVFSSHSSVTLLSLRRLRNSSARSIVATLKFLIDIDIENTNHDD